MIVTTKELFDTIHTSMPFGAGGSLDVKTYTDLTAFILQANGAKPGAAIALGLAYLALVG